MKNIANGKIIKGVGGLYTVKLLGDCVLPAGEHTVEWSFKAPRWGAVSTIMAICAAAILLWLVAVVVFYKRFSKYGK